MTAINYNGDARDKRVESVHARPTSPAAATRHLVAIDAYCYVYKKVVVTLIVFGYNFTVLMQTLHCFAHETKHKASAICQMPSTVSSASSPQHSWDPRISVAGPTVWNSLSLSDHFRYPAVDSE